MKFPNLTLRYALARQCTPKKATADIKALKQLELVKSVAVEGNMLKVKTKLLFCEDVLLGRYTITVSMKGGDYPELRIVNESPLVYDTDYEETIHHPFVFGEEGRDYCWGNAYIIYDLLRAADFPTFISVLIEFLQATASGGGVYWRKFVQRKEQSSE